MYSSPDAGTDQNSLFLFFCFEYKILPSFTNETNSFSMGSLSSDAWEANKIVSFQFMSFVIGDERRSEPNMITAVENLKFRSIELKSL